MRSFRWLRNGIAFRRQRTIRFSTRAVAAYSVLKRWRFWSVWGQTIVDPSPRGVQQLVVFGFNESLHESAIFGLKRLRCVVLLTTDCEIVVAHLNVHLVPGIVCSKLQPQRHRGH